MILSNVTVGEKINRWYSFDAFEDCYSLEEFVVDPSNRIFSSIDGVLFNKTATKLVKYPCARQGAYTVPSSVTTISTHAFHQCRLLTELTIPDSVTELEASCISYCSSLTKINLGSGITKIPYGSFDYLSALKSIVIPANVKLIDEWAFNFNDALESMIFLGEPPEIDEEILQGEELSEGDNGQPEYYPLPVTMYYLTEYAQAWAPNGETTLFDWSIRRLKYGDVNNDNAVDAADAADILRHIVKLSILPSEARVAADVDMDGRLSAADASKILRYLVKIDSPWPNVI